MKDMTNQVVVLTGASRGIGRALVDEVLEAGAKKVYATARNIEGLRELESERVVALELNVRDEESIAHAASVATDATMLINNAGTLASYDVLTATRESLMTDFETNVFGLLQTTKAFVGILEGKQDAAVVNLLTLVSVASMPAIGGYSASKAAAWSLTMALRAQLAARGIAVHGVYPGAVDTDMIRAFEMPKTSAKDVAKAIVDGVRRGVSMNVARATIAPHRCPPRRSMGRTL